MDFNTIIMWVSAVGCLLGGLDRMLGNRFGLGEKFEEGLNDLGPLALSMGGLICLAPVVSNLIGPAISPFFTAIGCDPAIFGAIFPNDTGGYPLAMALAETRQAGLYSGLIVSSMFGLTLSFMIPVGFSMIMKEDHAYYARGMLLGLIAVPFGSVIGGFVAGFSAKLVLMNTLPILVLVILICIGLKKFPEKMIKGCIVFGRIVLILCTIGLACAGFTFLTGKTLLPGLADIHEPLEIVAEIGVILMGMIPAVTLLVKLIQKPLAALGRKIGLDAASSAGVFISAVNPFPIFAMYHDMNPRGKVAVAAFSACASAALGDHLGFTAGVEPDYILPVAAGKLSGGVIALLLALVVTRKEAPVPAAEA